LGSFFVRERIEQLFSNYVWFEIFWRQNIGKKVASKMLMKLTDGDKERFIKGKKR